MVDSVRRCLITYKPLAEEENYYSATGLRQLSPRLTHLEKLPYSAEEQRLEALQRAPKMSIAGVQPKLSAVLRVSEGRFEVVDRGGRYVIKPQQGVFPYLPENEDLCMRLAAEVRISVPPHGLLYCKDGSYSYVIERFDRGPRDRRVHMEDFAQLAEQSRETKYNYSMEKLIPILDRHCSFPQIQRYQLFLRTLFNFLIGNEDMHLKNFSLLDNEDRIELAPAYDFVSSALVLRDPEEMALTLRGKRRRLLRADLVDYFGKERLALTDTAIDEVLKTLQKAIPVWRDLIQMSFLPADQKEKFLSLLHERTARLAL